MLLELLEDKHFDKLAPKTVFKLANSNANFSNLWLVHSIRSDCSLFELALAIAANIKWSTPALTAIENYLNIDTFTFQQISSEVEQALIDSKKIISDFCEIRQRKLLVKLHTIAENIPEATVIGDHKYTCHIPIASVQLDEILHSCGPRLKDVSLFGGEGKDTKNQSIRNNTHYPTPLPNGSVPLALLENVLAKATGLDISFAEPPVVLRYQPGQYYKWHYDHIHPHTEEITKHIEQFGQRIKTAIFYLNENFTGGETEFKTPFISVIPEKNKVLIFDNCDALKNRDASSIHRGNEITAGEKWIVTLWFRDKPFWLRSGLL